MKRCLAILFWTVSSLLAESNNQRVATFMYDWMVVCNMATADYQASADFQNLVKIDPDGATFVAEFWHSKAMSACIPRRDELVEQYANKETKESVTAEQKKLMMKELLHEVSLLRQAFYFDHSAEISAMIKMRITEFTEGRSPTASNRKTDEPPLPTR